MNREDLTKLLLDTPATIQAQELNLLQGLNEQIKCRQDCEAIEAPLKAEIGMNLSFKNQGQRDIALATQLKDNQAYQTLQQAQPNIDLAVKKAQIELEFQRNMLRSYLAIAGMITEAKS